MLIRTPDYSYCLFGSRKPCGVGGLHVWLLRTSRRLSGLGSAPSAQDCGCRCWSLAARATLPLPAKRAWSHAASVAGRLRFVQTFSGTRRWLPASEVLLWCGLLVLEVRPACICHYELGRPAPDLPFSTCDLKRPHGFVLGH